MTKSVLSSKAPQYPGPFQAHFLHPRFWLLWIGVGLFWLLGQMPMAWRHALAVPLGNLLYSSKLKRRSIAMTNMAICYPEKSEQERRAIVRAYFQNLVRVTLDFGFTWWASEKRFHDKVKIDGLEILEDLLAKGQRVVLVAGHSLSLDFGGMALTARVPLVTYANKARNPLVEWLMAKGRNRFGCRLYPRSAGLRGMLRDLKAGHVLYYLIDEDQGEKDSVFAPFFGKPKATLTAPGRVARMTDAVVIPCTTIYHPEEQRYVFTLYPPLENVPSDDVLADATAVNAALEKMIRLAPEQYMWTQRLFRTQPGGALSPYPM